MINKNKDRSVNASISHCQIGQIIRRETLLRTGTEAVIRSQQLGRELFGKIVCRGFHFRECALMGNRYPLYRKIDFTFINK